MTTGLQLSHCSSCDAVITWALTENDLWIPIDVDPHPAGNIELVTVDEKLYARVVTAERETEIEAELLAANRLGDLTAQANVYRSHFATCPSSALHRRRTTTTDRTGGATT
jgi:hypothetical protein